MQQQIVDSLNVISIGGGQDYAIQKLGLNEIAATLSVGKRFSADINAVDKAAEWFLTRIYDELWPGRDVADREYNWIFLHEGWDSIVNAIYMVITNPDQERFTTAQLLHLLKTWNDSAFAGEGISKIGAIDPEFGSLDMLQA